MPDLKLIIKDGSRIKKQKKLYCIFDVCISLAVNGSQTAGIVILNLLKRFESLNSSI